MSAYTDALRKIADLIETNDLDENAVSDLSRYWITLHHYGDEAKTEASKWRRALGGTWAKKDGGDTINLELAPGDSPVGIRVMQFLSKDACVRTVIGTETVVIPAVEAQPERVVEREIVEWDCGPVLEGVSA